MDLTGRSDGVAIMETEFNILVAEDDDGHFSLIKKNLARIGFRTRIRRFRDGRAILDFLMTAGRNDIVGKHKRFLLMLDIRMPKVSGVEVLEAIRGDEELKDIPAVMLTCSDDVQDIQRCHSLGVSDYIVKPIRTEQFRRAVERAGVAMLVSILETVAFKEQSVEPNTPACHCGGG